MLLQLFVIYIDGIVGAIAPYIVLPHILLIMVHICTVYNIKMPSEAIDCNIG